MSWRGKVRHPKHQLPRKVSAFEPSSNQHQPFPQSRLRSIYIGMTSTKNIGQGMTHEESFVMSFQLIQATACGVGCHQGAKTPFIGGARILLVQCWRDERFKDKPSTNINANGQGTVSRIPMKVVLTHP